MAKVSKSVFSAAFEAVLVPSDGGVCVVGAFGPGSAPVMNETDAWQYYQGSDPVFNAALEAALRLPAIRAEQDAWQQAQGPGARELTEGGRSDLLF
jgi:hypothetical protein